MRADRQRRQHLGLGGAQHAGPPFGAVTDGQVRYHLGERPAERRALRESGVHGGRQRPERAGRLGSQPDDLVTEPAGSGELAVEALYGRHGGCRLA